MAKFETFDRDIRLATEAVSAEATSAELAAFAKSELARVIKTGEGNANYTRFVDGIEGAPEESVEAPGPILYQFSWWEEIIVAALAELEKRSPRSSGRYASSFVVLASQQVVTGFDDISGGAEVIIFNAQPYTRKVEVPNAMQMSVPPRHFDMATRALVRKFGANGSFRFQTQFLNIASGLHPLVPYILKGQYGRRRSAQLSAAKAGLLQHGFKKLQRRQDRDVGKPITYPAIVINMVH
ncbi:MAG TPA: hypothetical protein VL133_13295 [Devosia sp.]|nr:hypothetical protein [Devosia sp.]